MLLPELGMKGVRTEHLITEYHLKSPLMVGLEQDMIQTGSAKKGLCVSQREEAPVAARSRNCSCVLRSGQTPDTDLPNFSVYLYIVFHGVLNSSCPHSMKIWTGH